MDCGKSQNKLVKKRPHKKHKTNKRRKQNESSGDESVDMSEEVFPIAHYVSNRDQMIEQVFSVMEKEKLNCMLPPILKGMTLSTLKESCLKELKNMSDEEVRKVLSGEVLETPSDNAITLELDSDSKESSSSVEECTNVEEKQKTLLDILEQEMQEIAYNTVLKRDEKTESDSDDLPEIVVITPTKSCSSQNNVPLICIDSGDEESTSPADVKSNLDAIGSCLEHTEDITVQKDNSVETPSGEIPVGLNPEINTGLHAATEDSDDLQVLSNPSKSSKENFLIKVYSNNNAPSERVVQKFFKSSCDDKDVDSIPTVVNREYEINKEGTSSQSTKDIVKETVSDVVQVDSRETYACETISCLSDNCEISNSIGSNITFEVPAGTSELILDEEKEEGEISEQESVEGVEIVKLVDDKAQSPTICLPSDSSSAKSDTDKSDLRNKYRKHYHKHRRSKHRTDSPERSRRRIEKRGNRSYRRKTVTAKAGSPEKYQEIATQEIDLNSISLPPGEMPVKVPSQNEETPKTPPLTDNNLLEHPIIEDVSKETANSVISPKEVEDEVKDKSCSFEESEELESVDPVSTKTSWADRWAEKKDLKKVVITSKICRNARKRILSARKKTTIAEPVIASTPVLPPVPPLVLHVEGSVQEYQMLQLLVNNGSDEENNESRNTVAGNSLDLVVPDSIADTKDPSSISRDDDCISTPNEGNQQEKT